MQTIEEIVEQCYHGLPSNDTKLHEVIGMVVQYITDNESVFDKNILFVKRLTKVAYHILRLNPDYLNGLLDRLFCFSIEGVEILRTAKPEDLTENNILSLEAHLRSYAADFAKAIYKKTGAVSWARDWYGNRIIAAEMTAETAPQFSAHSFAEAGDAANELGRKCMHEERWRWQQLAIGHYERFLEYYERNPNPEMRGIIHNVRLRLDHLKAIS